MPLLIVLSLAIQIACVVHVVRTGRNTTWIFIILAFPGLGSAVYFFLEMLPDLRNSRAARNTVKSLAKTLDPEADLRALARNLRLSDNVENKLKLAGECLERGLYAEAEDLYGGCLNGIYTNDPDILLGLARAQFLRDGHAQARATLERLIQAHPEFKSADGHLLYARSLEGMGDESAALAEYKVLADYYGGAEAKCRYALLLKKLGRTEEAAKLFREIVDYARDAPAFFRKSQKTWIDIARQNLA